MSAPVLASLCTTNGEWLVPYRMSRRFDRMYAETGRPSIPPEKLLWAQLIQMLYSVRSERLLREEIDDKFLPVPLRE